MQNDKKRKPARRCNEIAKGESEDSCRSRHGSSSRQVFKKGLAPLTRSSCGAGPGDCGLSFAPVEAWNSCGPHKILVAFRAQHSCSRSDGADLTSKTDHLLQLI